jgi:hypothetical protein
VREIRAFYLHATAFVVINALLHVINFVTAPDEVVGRVLAIGPTCYPAPRGRLT